MTRHDADNIREETMSSQPNFDALSRRGCEPKDPWLLAAKYRVCSTPLHMRRPKSTPVSRVRRRRCTSRADSDGGESTISLMTPASDITRDSTDFTEDYDFDDEEKKPDQAPYKPGSLSQKIYVRACRETSIIPTSFFIKHLSSDTLVMRNHVLGPKGARACALALSENGEIERLDMSGNGIGPVGAKYFAEMIEDNYNIKDLKLADNQLASIGAKLITDALLLNTSIVQLDLSGEWMKKATLDTNGRKQLHDTCSLQQIRFVLLISSEYCGNGFNESDAAHFRTLLLSNTTIRKLNLSNNCFRERGGEILGEILAKNKNLTYLNLSWNHLRRKGVVAIGKGISNNTSIKSLNVAWNGFYLEGCRSLAKALEKNRTMVELNLQANRINKECLDELLKGLRRNRTLTWLKLSDNPLTTEGAMTLLKCIKEVTTIGLKKLDLGEQCVEKEFVEVLLHIQNDRSLDVKYGVVLRDETTDQTREQALVSEDPILVLMEFMKLKNLRLIDLFQSLDKDGNRSLSNQEIKAGLLEEGMPLSEKSLNKLLARLDRDKNGEIDFGELMVGQKSHRRRMNTTIEVTKEGEFSSREGDVARVRARLKELIHKKDKEILKRFQQRRLASAFAGDKRNLFGTRKTARPASTEPAMATLTE